MTSCVAVCSTRWQKRVTNFTLLASRTCNHASFQKSLYTRMHSYVFVNNATWYCSVLMCNVARYLACAWCSRSQSGWLTLVLCPFTLPQAVRLAPLCCAPLPREWLTFILRQLGENYAWFCGFINLLPLKCFSRRRRNIHNLPLAGNS